MKAKGSVYAPYYSRIQGLLWDGMSIKEVWKYMQEYFQIYASYDAFWWFVVENNLDWFMDGGRRVTKRKSRMTEEEQKMHSEAVRVRKMTDRQLCGYLDGLRRQGEDGERVIREMAVRDFLTRIRKGDIPGIGKVTLKKLEEAADAMYPGR